MSRFYFVDVETVGSKDYPLRSARGVKEVGLYNYMKHAKVVVFCCQAYTANDFGDWVPTGEQCKISSPYWWKDGEIKLPKRFLEPANGDKIVAHNAEFDYLAMRKLGCKWPISSVVDTATMSLALGGPFGLDKALKRFCGDDVSKMEGGADLVKKFGVTHANTESKRDSFGDFIVLEDGDIYPMTSDWEDFVNYCWKDVEVLETLYTILCSFAIDKKIEPSYIDQIFQLTLRMNFKGVKVRRSVLKKLKQLKTKIPQAQKDLFFNTSLKEFSEDMTNPNSDKQALEVFRKAGLELDSMNLKEVARVVQENPEKEEITKHLETYKNLKQTSLSKADALERLMSSDGRLRGSMRAFGTITGRWSSRGYQLQNLPRPVGTVKECREALERNLVYFDPQQLKLTMGLLRGLLIPKAGHKFFVADLSQIQPRIAFHDIKDHASLKMMMDGHDLYKKFASDAYNKKIEDVTDYERQTSKTAFLSLIFGTSANMMYDNIMADEFKKRLSGKEHRSFDETKEKASLRHIIDKAHLRWPQIRKRYKQLIEAFKRSAQRKDECFCLDLPSGRKIILDKPRFEFKRNDYGGFGPEYYYTLGNQKVFIRGNTLFNYIIQGTEADIVQTIVLEMHKEFGAVPNFGVHDEFIYEIKENDFDKYKAAWNKSGKSKFKKWFGIDFVASEPEMKGVFFK